MKKYLLLSIFSLILPFVNGLDTSGWKKLEKQSAKSLLKDGGFEENLPVWKNLDKGIWEIIQGAGRNGTKGLTVERKKVGTYILAAQDIELKPNTAYEFGGWVRTENVTGGGASLCIEWSNAETNKWVGGSYIGDVTGNNGWTELKGKFTTKKYPYPVRYQLTFYLRKESTGKAVFDDVYVRPDTAEWNAAMIHPIQETVTTADKFLELASFITGDYNYPGVKNAKHGVSVKIEGRNAFYPVEKNRVTVKLDKLAAGAKSMELKLLDTANKLILDEKVIPLQVVTPEERAARTVQIDARGRTLVNGEPFMPVGIFMTRLTKTQIDQVAEAGFNTILPYQSLNLSFSKEMSPERVREVLDYCHAKGIKVIFSIKDAMPAGATNMIQKSWNGITNHVEMSEAVVNAFKDHPAILAWYVCDEIQPTFIEPLIALRRRINRLDPNHPTYAIYYQFNSYERYLGCQDIFGIDPYPIDKKTGNDLATVINQAEGAEKVQRLSGSGGIAVWAAPQYMNMGVWAADGRKDPKVYYEKYRFPTADELRAMVALEIIYGVKGFVGYSYSSLFYGPDKEQFENAWPIVKEAVAFQNEIAPFVLSETAAPKVEAAVRKGEVFVRAFALPDGQIRVLAVAKGPGEFEAEIKAPAGLKSRYGHIDNRYIFKGSGICFDMLEGR